MADLVDLFWLGLLAASAGWSSFFSLFQRPGVRGWRNLGLLAGYALGLAAAIALPWQQALATWLLMGFGSGVLYAIYELIAYLRLVDRTSEARPKLSHLFNGLLLWPVMAPEAVEYLLAEVGVLKTAADTPAGT